MRLTLIITLDSRELVLDAAVLLLLNAVLAVTSQHPPILLPVVDRPTKKVKNMKNKTKCFRLCLAYEVSKES